MLSEDLLCGNHSERIVRNEARKVIGVGEVQI
jgi:hypothetical protein